jgi:hypothetical protein
LVVFILQAPIAFDEASVDEIEEGGNLWERSVAWDVGRLKELNVVGYRV